MDTILTIIAVLGLGALLISVFIFVMAARRFVSDEATPDTTSTFAPTHKPRTREDRRQQPTPNVFPININGRTVAHDRRAGADRREMGRQFA
jgi:hypothetical protein